MPKLPSFSSSRLPGWLHRRRADPPSPAGDGPLAGLPYSPSGPNRRRLVVVGAVVAVVVGGVVAAVAVGHRTTFDRAGAVQRVMTDSAGRISQSDAECYVDRVADEVGSKYLAAGARPPDAVIARLTSIRVDCIGVANLGQPSGGTGSTDVVPSTEMGNLPRRVGDDASLDALYQQCAAGVGQACDDLFDRSPVGSDYESFAVSCGGRTPMPRCAEVYVSPGVTNPPPP